MYFTFAIPTMTPFTTVMIIDDDADDRDMLIEAVKEISPEIVMTEAENGFAGLEKLKTGLKKPDIIFLDLNMPKMNGKQFLKNIKSCENLSLIPVVIYTTSKQIEDKEETEKLGAAYFLSKPVSFDKLKEEIKKVFVKMGKLVKA
jgi:CheY-like chemotaxis protein